MAIKVLQRLEILVSLSIIDNYVDPIELKYISEVAKMHNVSKEKLDEIFKKVANYKRGTETEVDIVSLTLSQEEKIELLQDIVQLMKLDKKIHFTEVNFCKNIAEKLGFNERVIDDLSKVIYSDPNFICSADLIEKIILKQKND